MVGTLNPNNAVDSYQQLVNEISFPIYYEDTDLSGFVYHANYLKYFERAREHAIGVDYLANLYQAGVHFVVNEATLKYRAPLGHGDVAIIRSVGSYSKSPMVPFVQKAYRKKQDSSLELVCEGRISIVALNKDNRPIRMPDHIIAYFDGRPKTISPATLKLGGFYDH